MTGGLPQHGDRPTVAVVGSGVSGLVAARLLHPVAEVTLYEAAPRLGGHVHTHTIERAGGRWQVDSGFIVFNERTYPAFSRLLEILGVPSRPSNMGFSVRCDRTGLEWSGTNLDTLFAQRRNLLRPSFLRMVADIVRFCRRATDLLEEGDESLTLGAWLARQRYSRAFVEHYVVPMGAAIWSAEPARMLDFPAVTFVRFFHNHGMLSLGERPTWRTVVGGSRRYVERLLEPLEGRLRPGTPVRGLRRLPDGVELRAEGEPPRRFDHVVLATHSDQALALLSDPTPAERALLGAVPYQENEAVLHVDESFLPSLPKVRAAWNYRIAATAQQRLSVTYDMNTLQGLEAPERFLVTLNPHQPVEPGKVLARMTYHHPVYDLGALAAQARRAEIDGVGRTHYCGAWWGYGFHEDGVQSALVVARRFGVPGIEGAALPAPLAVGAPPTGAGARGR